MPSQVKPLSEILRPKDLASIIGQDHLTGPEGFITKIIASSHPVSLLLWGPPGSGKTTIAKVYAAAFNRPFKFLSAIFSSVSDIKQLVHEAHKEASSLLLFVDEIHRFNKSQQDAFLPFIEDGSLILIGATSENPSFYLNKALLSRLRICQVHPLSDKDLFLVIERYEEQYCKLPLAEEARSFLVEASHGDARYLLNLVENIVHAASASTLTRKELESICQQRAAIYDKQSDEHYKLISALHKSVRGSDPDAALYWLARMLTGGEDPLFIARRLIRMAAEDIGLADPQALSLAIAARDTFQMLGSPEGELALAELAVYLALAPKSNSVYKAFKEAMAAAKNSHHMDPPSIIINGSTKMMKDMGYGSGYLYDHDAEDGFSGQNYFPNQMERLRFYRPVERGFERDMLKRIAYFDGLRAKRER